MSKWEIKHIADRYGINLPTFCIGYYKNDKNLGKLFQAVAYTYSEEDAAFILSTFEKDSTTDDYNWWSKTGYKRIKEVDPKRFPITELT
jgi:hypothetical protein